MARSYVGPDRRGARPWHFSSLRISRLAALALRRLALESPAQIRPDQRTPQPMLLASDRNDGLFEMPFIPEVAA